VPPPSLFLGFSFTASEPNEDFLSLVSLQNITQVAAVTSHSLAISTRGAVYSFGRNTVF
jgi:alpha-tubulin suppressor-like RCC1 family protein